MIATGVFSTYQFSSSIQALFQTTVKGYGIFFEKGELLRCLYVDAMTFLYISSILFKNLYYVVGGIFILTFAEFGRQLGIFASCIALVTEISARLLSAGIGEVAVVTPLAVSLSGFLFLVIGLSPPLFLIFLLTRKTVAENFK